ncbi:MAG: hypothetical protein LBG81_07285 [Coriobacteriaceae bacterium]|jgi:uncharacterized protein YoxC|nr:hypothetical protein [Coriobacteriaceae bacterium]
MSISEVLNIVLPCAYVLVFIALVWFILELIATARRARSVVTKMQKKINPTLEHMEKITAALEPVVSKVDPLVERVSLAVDATNLEIMRLDQILEDVSEITATLSSAANAVDTAANAPFELVNNVSSRVRKVFSSRHASPESTELGERKAADAREVAQDVKHAASEDHDKARQRIARHIEESNSKQRVAEVTHETAARMNESVRTAVGADAEEIRDRYFTYLEGEPHQNARTYER